MGSRVTKFTVLRIVLAAFFILLGIAGVSSKIGEGSFFQLASKHTNLEVIFGVVEIVCGAILLLGMFHIGDAKIFNMATLVIMIFWAIRIVLTRFVWGFNFITKKGFSMPLFIAWLLSLSCELIIGLGVWCMYGDD